MLKIKKAFTFSISKLSSKYLWSNYAYKAIRMREVPFTPLKIVFQCFESCLKLPPKLEFCFKFSMSKISIYPQNIYRAVLQKVV